MKVLYALRGTGIGRVNRAKEIIPVIGKKCKTDVLVSGAGKEMPIPFGVKYNYQGLHLLPGMKGKSSLLSIFLKSDLKKFRTEIKSLAVEDYDIVINDFEPVSAWACYLKNVPCISLSHESSLLFGEVPHPHHKDRTNTSILRLFAPANIKFGFHFRPYNRHIFTPVIRSEIRHTEPNDKGHYTVYLPGVDLELLTWLFSTFSTTRWEVFSDQIVFPSTLMNIKLFPFSDERFVKSMANSTGVMCGAGFSTPAEALYLGKKLLVIPLKHRFGQYHNAIALNRMGVPVITDLNYRNLATINAWLKSDQQIPVFYPDLNEAIVQRVFESYVRSKLNNNTTYFDTISGHLEAGLKTFKNPTPNIYRVQFQN
jgi:uncharacterized protein (TIGR00661 family)